MPLLTLIRHPSTPCAAVRRLTAKAQLLDGRLTLHYAMEGDMDAIRMLPASPPHRSDRLWQSTCFEAFVKCGAGYYEFNFAPSSAWAAYRFEGYREGMAELELPGAPAIALRHCHDRLELDAVVDLPPSPEKGDWRLALAAVVEDRDGQISYWALAHPKDAPDFHDDGGFIARFDPYSFSACKLTPTGHP
ncbi:MAG: DOMON-like domain-containing protein [Candidatus Methylumidiphilus sp.]